MDTYSKFINVDHIIGMHIAYGSETLKYIEVNGAMWRSENHWERTIIITMLPQTFMPTLFVLFVRRSHFGRIKEKFCWMKLRLSA